VITGGGGAGLDVPENYGNSPLSARLEFSYHVTKVSIDGDSLLLEAIKPNGEVFDSYPISKKPGFGFPGVYRMLGNPAAVAILVIISLFIIVVVRRELSKKRR